MQAVMPPPNLLCLTLAKPTLAVSIVSVLRLPTFMIMSNESVAVYAYEWSRSKYESVIQHQQYIYSFYEIASWLER